MDTVRNPPDELKNLRDFVKESSERLSLRSKLLADNVAAIGKWPDDSFFMKKDSSLKKNTAFVKKIRNFLDSQKESLLVEFESLNLSKYVEEVSTAIVEAKIKATDIPFMLKLCSEMHQRYAEFGSLFLDAWKKVFISCKDIKHANLSKLRVDLALFADLNTVGIFRESEGIRLLATQLTSLTNGDTEHFSNIGIVCSFCRHCSDDWIGLIPRRIRILSEANRISIPRSSFLPSERQAKCRALFHDYLSGARRYLQQTIKEAGKVIASNREQMENRGEVSEERQERADQLVASCRKFYESLCVLSDLLDSDPPADFSSMLSEDSKTDTSDRREPDQDTCVSSQLFEDEDTRLFYESLPDIKAMVPGILYKESEHSKPEQTFEKPEELDTLGTEDIDVETVESELAKEEALYKAIDDGAVADNKDAQSSDRGKPPSTLIVDEVDDDPSSCGKILMETFLTQLPNCINRDLIDRAAIDFCLNLNKRSNRKRLARTLLNVPRTRYDLLPFYSRLVAALAPVMPDLVADVNTMLMGEFRWRVSKRDQMNLESKFKIVRFIGELVKFRIFPAHQALSCLKQLLPQFVHHNIEMACALLDTCGRFLYRLPSSHQRTKVYLEVMLRKKMALHMDQRYAVMIENTYYYCNPPISTQQITSVVELTPVMRYLRHLLWCDVDRSTVNNVLRSFRRIDWEDSELVRFIETLFTRAWEVPYTKINCVASILSGLAPFHNNFATAVVDNVIEDIRVGMELNSPQLSQRRISMVRYLGLLYVYCLVDSPVIFKTLYSLLTFGVSLDNNLPSLLDPPDSLFRITLICTLLDTLGDFFDQGKKRRKLNIFLVYFQRYYWFKRSQPFWVQPFPATTASKTQSSDKKDAITDQSISGSDDTSDLGDSGGQSNAESLPTTSDDSLAIEAGSFALMNENQASPLIFTPVAFPTSVEQQYVEALAHLRFSVSQAKNFHQAQHLVSRLEARYLPRLARLKATYGLMNGIEEDSECISREDKGSLTFRSSRADGPGRMDTITEEVEPGDEIPLDEEDYAIDDDDDDDDDDDFVEGEKNGGEEQDENRSRRRTAAEQDYGRIRHRIVENQDDKAHGNRETSLDVQMTLKSDVFDDERTDATDSEEERLVLMGLKPRYIDCAEDAEFREALDRITAEALLSTGTASTATGSGSSANVVNPVDLTTSSTIRPPPGCPILPSLDTLHLVATRARSGSIPSVVAGACGKQSAQTPVYAPSLISVLQTKSDEENRQPSATTITGSVEQPNTVVFNLITRRGNRPHLVPLAVPETVQFAARYVQAEAAEREEKARMKQLVLEMHEAQKEEEMEWGHLGSQDAVLAHQFPINVNRDRWVKYHHPKGAPDADAVFGGSSQRR